MQTASRINHDGFGHTYGLTETTKSLEAFVLCVVIFLWSAVYVEPKRPKRLHVLLGARLAVSIFSYTKKYILTLLEEGLYPFVRLLAAFY